MVLLCLNEYLDGLLILLIRVLYFDTRLTDRILRVLANDLLMCLYLFKYPFLS